MALYEREHAKQRENATEYSAEDAEQYLRLCVEREGTETFNILLCSVKSVESNRQAQTAYYDIEAQQDMARWAYGMFLASIFGLIVSACGLGTLFYTLRLNRTATKAAVDAVEINRTNAETELRAWIGYSTWGLVGYGRDGEVEGYLIHIEWKNYGSTPGKRVICVTGRPDEKVGFNESGGSIPPNIGDGTVSPPGVTFQSEPIVLTPEQVLATQDNPILVRSTVRYDCVFDGMKDRRSDVTMRFRYIGMAGIEAIRAGGIGPGNFAVQPSGQNEMT
jgi:hypothetical protein